MSEENGQNIPTAAPKGGPHLLVVATPIGNLADLSPRAREALVRADAILCEDTRQGAKLLSALGIARPMSCLERLDAHTSASKFSGWTERVLAGETLALITDAGTPGVSDPGSALVAHVQAAGARIEPIPGPSAVLALLSASGFSETSFTFRGFFPRKPGDQEREIQLAAESALGGIFVWFESPHRIEAALGKLAECQPEARVVVAKELTKLHESFFVGSAPRASAEVAAEIGRVGERGEWCFAAVFPNAFKGGLPKGGDHLLAWRKALQCLLEANVAVSEASRRIAEAFDQPKKQVYACALQISGQTNGKKSERGG
jgi:16S rRNA (cytidine1402-2'-O)-methyltransferase